MLARVDLSHAKDTSKLAIVSHVSPVFHPGRRWKKRQGECCKPATGCDKVDQC